MQEVLLFLYYTGDDYMDNVSSEKLYYSVYDTFNDKVTIICNDDAVVGLKMGEVSVENGTCQRTPLMDKAVKELKEYLQGERKYFDVLLKFGEIQICRKKVWTIYQTCSQSPN